MQIVERDIFDRLVSHYNAVVCHQVNCQRVMGSGIAKIIRDKFPDVYAAYRAKHDWELADCQIVRASQYDANVFIANLAGQDGFGTDKVQTEYWALYEALRVARDFADANGLTLCIPYGMGCGLAGGDWNKVSEAIDRIAPNAVIYRLPA